jgi:hypothetical protein
MCNPEFMSWKSFKKPAAFFFSFFPHRPVLRQTIKFSFASNVSLSTRMVHNLIYHMAVLRIRIRRIYMFLGLPEPDLLVRDTDPDPSIIEQK